MTASPSTEPRVAQPTISVIIPSYNRCASLRRAVLSLCEQDYPLALAEVIVVLDGGSDGSAAMLAELALPFHLDVIEQANQGAALARNHGAARASGEVLIFMDDDMEASLSYLTEHAAPHADSSNRVVIGYFTAKLDARPSYFSDQLRGWWAAMFRRMRDEGHRFAYTDLLSGNFSVGKRLFEQVGCFRGGLYSHEDYELGFRLLAAGAEFVFAEGAACVHHERSELHQALQRKRGEGMEDVQLGQMHPSLRAVLPMRHLRAYLALSSRIMLHLAFAFPALGDLLAWACERTLPPLERARLYAAWLRLLTGLVIYWYWRGVAKELPSIEMLNEFLSAGEKQPEQPALIVRLEEGVDAAAACLDEARPRAAAIYYRDGLLGSIPALPGTEPLQGRHLKPLLWEHFRVPLLQALAREQSIGIPVLDECLTKVAAQAMRTWKEPVWRI